jgi:hypothetical protein
MKFTNLNLNLFYNFTFFGSRIASDNRTAIYKIGNLQSSLNCSNNVSNTAQINNIKPDAEGCIYVTITTSSGSLYGYLSALEIESSTATKQVTVQSAVIANNITINDTSQNTVAFAYPNPFTDDVFVKVFLEKEAAKVNVVVSDALGRVVYNQQFGNIPGGVWNQRLALNERDLKPGLYFIRVITPGSKPLVIKLLKQ